jgi:hypothetical protein
MIYIFSDPDKPPDRLATRISGVTYSEKLMMLVFYVTGRNFGFDFIFG